MLIGSQVIEHELCPGSSCKVFALEEVRDVFRDVEVSRGWFHLRFLGDGASLVGALLYDV